MDDYELIKADTIISSQQTAKLKNYVAAIPPQIPNIRDTIDYSKFVKNDTHIEIGEDIKKIVKSVDKTASNTEMTAEYLKVQNELLTRELFKIQKGINELFSVIETNGEENVKLIYEANEIAKKIQDAIDSNKKFDWKSFGSNTGAQAAIMALQMYIQKIISGQ